MMFGLITMVLCADSKEQLDSDTEAVLSVARKHMCQLATLKFQQLDGLNTVVRIFPALLALLAAVSMLRASGALDALTRLCAPVLAWLGIPPETAILMVVRPVSGSGALAAASDIIGTYGPDSRIGRTAAVMLGSTETTFYVLAVYFGACGVRRSRWAIPAAIAADLTGFLVAAALVRWIWGT